MVPYWDLQTGCRQVCVFSMQRCVEIRKQQFGTLELFVGVGH
jgi:hypothetical protein